MRIVYIMSLCCIWMLSYGQQDPHFSQYVHLPILINPAAHHYADSYTRFYVAYRNQWTGYQSTYGESGAPTTQLVAVSMPAYAIKGEVSGLFINDQLGPQNNVQALIGYAYNHTFSTERRLSIGFLGGIYSQTLDFDQLRFIDPQDPQLSGREGKDAKTKPDLSGGIWYSHKQMYLGVSITHLTAPVFDYGSSQEDKLRRHAYITGGYNYNVSFNFKLQLATLIKTDGLRSSYDLSAIGYAKDTMWGGVSMRQSEAVILLLGTSLMPSKALKIGYSLDLILKEQAAKKSTSHEIVIRYEIPVVHTQRSQIRTPRFRY